MAWSDAARAAALEVRRRKSMHYIDDNPGGRWLKEAMWKAARRLRNPKYQGIRTMSGPVTAVVDGRLPSKLLTQLPGLNNEHKFITSDSPRLKEMIKYIKEHGPIKGPVSGGFYKPFINVNYRGEAYINEGNHRVRAYAALGKKDIPVRIQYYAGGERRRGPASLVTILKYMKRKRPK